MIENRYKEAYVEVLSILNHMEKETLDKVPEKLILFFQKNASTSYTVNLDYSKDISDMNLKRETLALLAMLYRNYWCNVEERELYDALLSKNEAKHQAKLSEKYNPDNLFKDSKTQAQNKTEQNNNSLTVIPKNSLYQKIVDFIKNIFTKK